MEVNVYAILELDDGTTFVAGEMVSVVVSGSGAVVEGKLTKIAKKNIEIALDELYSAKVLFEDMEQITKL